MSEGYGSTENLKEVQASTLAVLRKAVGFKSLGAQVLRNLFFGFQLLFSCCFLVVSFLVLPVVFEIVFEMCIRGASCKLT